MKTVFEPPAFGVGWRHKKKQAVAVKEFLGFFRSFYSTQGGIGEGMGVSPPWGYFDTPRNTPKQSACPRTKKAGFGQPPSLLLVFSATLDCIKPGWTFKWRRGWDSNPRTSSSPVTRFRVERVTAASLPLRPAKDFSGSWHKEQEGVNPNPLSSLLEGSFFTWAHREILFFWNGR